ncbi:hypothetical protein BHE74_00025004 [Ensete ventricosum]|nr:hypothetical protein GW17_00021520 [Ensete ventricosum]RWW67544.1 hypothetical protein BHE74_00025004 [Ensete ventricosum]RZS03425.1 hypothetical protein BHM03_00033606 [Ensete ventricosum]
MPLTRQPKKDRNISDPETYAIASEDLSDAKLEAREMRMEDKLHTLFVEPPVYETSTINLQRSARPPQFKNTRPGLKDFLTKQETGLKNSY